MSHGINSESHIASKGFDGSGWSSKHAPAFDKLIQNARQNVNGAVNEHRDGIATPMATNFTEAGEKPVNTENGGIEAGGVGFTPLPSHNHIAPEGDTETIDKTQGPNRDCHELGKENNESNEIPSSSHMSA